MKYQGTHLKGFTCVEHLNPKISCIIKYVHSSVAFWKLYEHQNAMYMYRFIEPLVWHSLYRHFFVCLTFRHNMQLPSM